MLNRFQKALLVILSCPAIGFTPIAGAAELTIAEKLSDIMDSKEQIRQAIESYGVSIPSNTPLSQYSVKIGLIKNVPSICSATSPSSCNSYTNNYNVNENTVSGCSGGSAGGSPVTTFVVGGYCSSTDDSGDYALVQTCSNCTVATNASGSQTICFCKIHSINGTAVASSSRFMFSSISYGTASDCARYCADICASGALDYSGFRSTLFSALGD